MKMLSSSRLSGCIAAAALLSANALFAATPFASPDYPAIIDASTGFGDAGFFTVYPDASGSLAIPGHVTAPTSLEPGGSFTVSQTVTFTVNPNTQEPYYLNLFGTSFEQPNSQFVFEGDGPSILFSNPGDVGSLSNTNVSLDVVFAQNVLIDSANPLEIGMDISFQNVSAISTGFSPLLIKTELSTTAVPESAQASVLFGFALVVFGLARRTR